MAASQAEDFHPKSSGSNIKTNHLRQFYPSPKFTLIRENVSNEI
jgi:hypothetical protein